MGIRMSQKLRGTEDSFSRNMPMAQLAHRDLRLGAETRVRMLVLLPRSRRERAWDQNDGDGEDLF